jgi:teichuronic acid biosynthesis glycosyltransferase TuaC
MRVLFLVTDFPSTTQPASGIFHKTQAEALERLGVTVDVVAPTPAVPLGLHLIKKRWGSYHEVPRRYADGSVQVWRPRYVHWPLRLRVGPGAEKAFGRAALRAHQGNPDLLHAHFAYPAGLAAAWLARRRKVPSVLTLHGSDVNVLPLISRKNRVRFIRAVKAASAVIAVSAFLAQRTEQLTGRRPVVMPVGIRLGLFRNAPSRAAARESIGVAQDSRLVAYVGQVARAKGLAEFREALARLSPERVSGIVVGDGPLRREMEATSNIRCFGPQSNDRIPAFMAAADAVVLPSYSEGLPTVLVEAGAVGTPVVATEVGGIPELLGGGRGELIPPRSVDALTEAIRSILADRAAAADRANRLRAHVTELYDADQNAARLLELYRDLLSNGSDIPVSPSTA